MKMLFVDTAGWVAAADGADAAHDDVCAARDAWLATGGILVSSDFVFDETLTLLKVKLGATAAEAWWRQIETSRRLRVEAINVARQERARLHFFRHRDKSYSFTDCTSFVLMQELRIRQALTLDRHFRLAGFDVIP